VFEYKIFLINLLLNMQTNYAIRQLVEKALYIKQLTPDIENAINSELTQLGYVSDVDYEALELLMTEMDAGRIQLVPSL
jgi:GTP-dependent phosphoenolpyruvate carboxykinase